MRVPFVGGAYAVKVRKADVQRSINLMPTLVESGSGKAQVFLQSIPGLTEFSTSALAIVKTQALATLAPGATQTYTLVATNQGPVSADGASVIDALPAGFTFTACSIAYSAGTSGPATATAAALASGVAITIWPALGTAAFTITGTFAAEGSASNSASVSGASSTVTTTISSAVYNSSGTFGSTGGAATGSYSGAALVPSNLNGWCIELYSNMSPDSGDGYSQGRYAYLHVDAILAFTFAFNTNLNAMPGISSAIASATNQHIALVYDPVGAQCRFYVGGALGFTVPAAPYLGAVFSTINFGSIWDDASLWGAFAADAEAHPSSGSVQQIRVTPSTKYFGATITPSPLFIP